MDGQLLTKHVERSLIEHKPAKQELAAYLDVLPQNHNRIVENDRIVKRICCK